MTKDHIAYRYHLKAAEQENMNAQNKLGKI